ncbi:class III lanthipeptide [Staphylococcus shinii]
MKQVLDLQQMRSKSGKKSQVQNNQVLVGDVLLQVILVGSSVKL